MVKMSFTNNQTAFEYVVYMMFGSYFDKAVCKNKLLEKKMYVHYLEQKERNQIQMENLCIHFIEKKLMKKVPEALWNQQVEVRFAPTGVEGLRDIQFHGSEYILRVSAIYRGKRNTEIQYEVWQKEPHLVFFLLQLVYNFT